MQVTSHSPPFPLRLSPRPLNRPRRSDCRTRLPHPLCRLPRSLWQRVPLLKLPSLKNLPRYLRPQTPPASSSNAIAAAAAVVAVPPHLTLLAPAAIRNLHLRRRELRSERCHRFPAIHSFIHNSLFHSCVQPLSFTFSFLLKVFPCLVLHRTWRNVTSFLPFFFFMEGSCYCTVQCSRCFYAFKDS